jgi:8-oxo-dGTP pyrophosphatase MutT (NUDIX family)
MSHYTMPEAVESQLRAGPNSPQPTLLDLVCRIWLWLAYRVMVVYWRLLKPRTSGAFVRVRADGKLLVIRNSYKPGLGLPGGGIAAGESPVDAAVRELYEETGICTQSSDLRRHQLFHFKDEGKSDVVYIYDLSLPSVPSLRIDNREVSFAAFVDERMLCEVPRTKLLSLMLAATACKDFRGSTDLLIRQHEHGGQAA